ncbi:MAG: cell division protein FtsQ/DivIB [Candidatus Omnitrophota bacterium]
MGNKKKSKSRKKNGGRKNRIDFSFSRFLPAKIILPGLLTVLIGAGIFFGIRYFFLNSRFFSIKEIVVNKDQGYIFREGDTRLRNLYIGRNIFSIDLRQVQILIKNDFPQLKKIEARRVLPDILEIDIISREPVAVIDAGGGIVIDNEGIVLTVGEQTKDLVRIRGLSFFLNMPSRGQKIDNTALGKALVLFEAIRKKMPKILKDVEYIDISDKNNMIVRVNNMNVKMGTEDFFKKITGFRQIMNDPNININDIKYIDMRFDEPVISFK